MRSALAPACGLLALCGISSLQGQSESMSVASFRSVETRNGAHTILRHGPTQRVTFLKGSPDYSQVAIASGGRLVIDKCRSKCPRGYELEVEIITPELARITVAQGGWLESRGSFARQAEIGVTVDNGGTIDIRSMSVESVTASVLGGGRILTKPISAMVASVVDGGNITYWGDARVTPSIEHGGVITKGAPSDADRPFSEVVASGDAVPAIHVIPPIEGRRNP